MRILTVSHFYEAHGGGLERVAGQLCREFAAAGHDAVWVASDADAPPLGAISALSVGAITALSVGAITALPLRCVNPTERLTGLPMPIPGWRGLRALWHEVGRSDIVIVHDSLYVTSICAMLAARLQRRKVVLIQHIAGIAFSSALLRGIMALANLLVTRPMLRAADRLVFISDTVRRDLLGDPARRDYRLVFNGVDRAVFYPAATPQQSAPPILFVGRYVEKKGLAVIRALAMLRPDLTFYLAGSGPISPSGWGLANVRDLGPQTPQALANLYRSAALLLLPSVGEGYPLVIQEAMACGLPVICGQPSNRADPAAAQWLTGVAIDLGDPDGSALRCADAITGLRIDSEGRVAMADYAAGAYSWQAMAKAVLE